MGPGGVRAHIGDTEILKRENPVYPASQMANGVEDDVELEVTIDKHGVPTEVKVAKAHVPVLAAEALRAVRQGRFAAVRREGVPVRATFLLDVCFIITNRAVKRDE
jgi:TonB family protein